MVGAGTASGWGWCPPSHYARDAKIWGGRKFGQQQYTGKPHDIFRIYIIYGVEYINLAKGEGQKSVWSVTAVYLPIPMRRSKSKGMYAFRHPRKLVRTSVSMCALRTINIMFYAGADLKGFTPLDIHAYRYEPVSIHTCLYTTSMFFGGD